MKKHSIAYIVTYTTISLFALLAFSSWVVWGMSDYMLRFCSQALATVIILASLRILVGIGGVISFGHALYVGAGGYAAAHAMLWLEHTGYHVPLFIIPLVGGLAGFCVAVIAGWLSTRRTNAIYTTMVTLALAELVHVMAQAWVAVFGGDAGLQIDRSIGNVWGMDFVDGRWMVFLSFIYAALVLLLVRGISKSVLGVWLVAVREDAQRVACLGVSPQQVQYHAFLISGFLAGLGGALLVLEFEMVESSIFSMANSAYYLIFACIGGLGSSLGSVLGGCLQVFAQIGLPMMTEYAELWVGIAMVLIVLFCPQGLVSLWSVLPWFKKKRGG